MKRWEGVIEDLAFAKKAHLANPGHMKKRRRYARALRRANNHPDRPGARIASEMVKMCDCEGPHAVCYWCSNGAIIGTDGRG